MDNLDDLKKRVLAIRAGSTKKHYKVSIGEICDVLLILVEQLKRIENPVFTVLSQEVLDEPTMKTEVDLPPTITTTLPPEND